MRRKTWTQRRLSRVCAPRDRGRTKFILRVAATFPGRRNLRQQTGRAESARPRKSASTQCALASLVVQSQARREIQKFPRQLEALRQMCSERFDAKSFGRVMTTEHKIHPEFFSCDRSPVWPF